jgi:hypothetical protein
LDFIPNTHKTGTRVFVRRRSPVPHTPKMFNQRPS